MATHDQAELQNVVKAMCKARETLASVGKERGDCGVSGLSRKTT